MKPWVLAAVGVVPIAALLGAGRSYRARGEIDRSAAVRALLDRSADSLGLALRALDATLAKPTHEASAESRAAFRGARARYKRMEGALEFYAPALASAFNSRRLEVDDDDAPPPSTLAPSGFPVLESLLWPELDARHVDSARKVIAGMMPLVARVHVVTSALRVTAAQVIELDRLELARISSLGIAGFDTPRTHDAMAEAASALDGLREIDETFGRREWTHSAEERRERAALDTSLARAARYLRAAPSFETFNRLAFIAFYSVPASNALDRLRRATGTQPVLIARGWRVEAPSIYSPNAFDARAYAPTTAPAPTLPLVSLGAQLFADTRLSGTGTRSCASCHQPGRAFTDGVARAASIATHGGVVARNTPTLLNAALQPAQFADERAVTLEDQVLEVLRSPTEMGSSAEQAAERLRSDASYRAMTAAAFSDTAGLTALRLRQSLAAYVRSLMALDSRFDRAVQGDTLALSAEERRGFTVFMGKAGCGTCHFAPLFSGNTPPLYLSSDVEVVGTTASPGSRRVDADSGRARIDHLPIHLRAFKTPSLRDVARTAPYMHNGAFATLDDVLAFYDRGGGAGSGARVDNQTLSADSLHLTSEEKRAVIAFLGSLSSGGRR